MSMCELVSPVKAENEGKAAIKPTKEDIEYAKVGDRSLKLDLYLPKATHPPLIIYVHGGGWGSGSKKDMPLGKLLPLGYAVAGVDYRLSGEAPFPAQIYDLKAAIRFLRAKAAEYGYDSTRFVIAGGSAGGHLAALVGVTNHSSAHEGNEGDFVKESSEVQAIADFFGASNLETILSQSTPFGLKVRTPALQRLLGGSPEEKPELAKLASPVNFVKKDSPPLLLIHGDADPQMPPQQSRDLQAAYEKAGSYAQLILIPGAKHGGKVFYDEERTAIVKEFLEKHLPGTSGAR